MGAAVRTRPLGDSPNEGADEVSTVERSALYERGEEILSEIKSQPQSGRQRFPALPPELADDVGRKLIEFCFGDCWGRPNSYIDLKTRRLLTIAALVAMGRERQLRSHISGALAQGLSREEITESLVHLIAYCGFPAGMTALQIANEVFAEQRS